MKAFLAALALVCLVASVYAEEQAAKPDLEIVSVRAIPEQILIGKGFTVEYVVRNNGPGTFEGGILIKTTIGNMTRAQEWGATLQSGENITTRQPWTQGLYIAGEYDITVTVDPKDEVDESDESNNEVSSVVPEIKSPMMSISAAPPPEQGENFAPESTSQKSKETFTSIARVIVITEYESGETETRVYGGGEIAIPTSTAAAPDNSMLILIIAAACAVVAVVYLMKKRSASTDLEPELEQLKREKEEIEKVIEMAKVKYYKRAIDEASYREIITENQQRLMHIEARMGALENRVDKIEKKLK